MSDFLTASEIEELNEVDLANEVRRIKELIRYNEFSSNQQRQKYLQYLERLQNRLKEVRKNKLKERLTMGRNVVADESSIPQDGRRPRSPVVIGELTEEDLRRILEESKNLEENDPDVKRSLSTIADRRKKELQDLAEKNGHSEGPQGDLMNPGVYESEKRRLNRPAKDARWTQNEKERQHYGNKRNLEILAREHGVVFIPLGDLSDDEQYGKEFERLNTMIAQHEASHSSGKDGYATMDGLDKVLLAFSELKNSDVLTNEIKEEIEKLLQPANIALFSAIFAAFLLLQSAGPLAWVATGAGIVLLIATFGTHIIDLGRALAAIANAKNKEEFQQGVELLAQTIAKLGIDFLITIVSMGAAKIAGKAATSIRSRFKVPDPPVTSTPPSRYPPGGRRLPMYQKPPPETAPPSPPSTPRYPPGGKRLPIYREPPPTPPQPSTAPPGGRRLPMYRKPPPETVPTKPGGSPTNAPNPAIDPKGYMEAWANEAVRDRAYSLKNLMKENLAGRAFRSQTGGVGGSIESLTPRLVMNQSGVVSREIGLARLWVSSSAKYTPRKPWWRDNVWEELVPWIKKVSKTSKTHHAERQLITANSRIFVIGATKPYCPHCSAHLYMNRITPATEYTRMGIKRLQAFLGEIGVSGKVLQKHVKALRKLFRMEPGN
ncbi:hypothetical protein [Flagellimonas sp.]|uniref:hypothetical protein n=1 Tax=Flagellimonas sp. TaxID=2058762 RepID=UPI003B50F500